MDQRVQIQHVTPSVNHGRYAAKAVVGDTVQVAADVFRDGHEPLRAIVRFRGPGDQAWQDAPLYADSNDRWFGGFTVDRMGSWQFAIQAWTDHYQSWLNRLGAHHAAGHALALLFEEGALLLEHRTLPPHAQQAVTQAATLLRAHDVADVDKVAAASAESLMAVLNAHPEQTDASLSAALPLWVDRERARFSAWYELFPRSEGAPTAAADGSVRAGTFDDASKRLPQIASMGFDVVYLPPIHPIGQTHRKGPNNSLIAGPDDPGVPWAIGSQAGGHTAVHPDLGTIDDFDQFVARCQELGMEVALDYAAQCSPDHPWVHEHPEWFRHRPDGSIAYAENPPKVYQDIYPLDFDTADQEGLWNALHDIFRFWMAHGVRIFRVDNPHTKSLAFWEWVIGEIKQTDPDVLFLSEAFTRPKLLQTLAKLGFSQSYTYFAWRTTKDELTSYVSELAHSDVADYLHPNFWPNTPDILTAYLVEGGRPAFKIRLILAALLSPAYGITAGYELCENTPLRPGSEEYLDSEKYQFKTRNYDDPDSLAPWITTVNTIRRNHRCFRELRTVAFHHISNEQLLCFSKTTAERGDPVLVIVNLDPHHPQEGVTWLDLWQLGLQAHDAFDAHDLITDTTYLWQGPENFVRLDPSEPAHVLRLSRRT